MRLVTLSENTAGQPGMLAEWGLCILIESPESRILVDCGAGTTAVKNAATLGIDLKLVDSIILTHAHTAHSGGLAALLTAIGHPVEVIAHPDIFQEKYCRIKDPADYIGIPQSQAELEALGARFKLSRQPEKLTESISTSGEIDMQTDFERIDGSLYIKSGEKFMADPLADELAVYITSERGLIMLSGCAHRGTVNALKQGLKLSGLSRVYLALGGSHLKDASTEKIWQTISALNELGVQKLAACHCTGLPAMLLLSQTFGKNFIFNHAGNIINLT